MLMKKKVFYLLAIMLVGGSLMMNSCKKEKDEFTEEDAYNSQADMERLRDSLRTIGGIIDYSVGVVGGEDAGVVSPSGKGTKDNKGMDSATITVSQHGRTITVTTTTTGIAAFPDLRIGTANVSIRRPGYTSVDYVVELTPLSDTTILNYYNVRRQVGTLVALFSTTKNLSTIKGLAKIESDLTNYGPEIAANVELMGVIDVDNASFISNYLYNTSFVMGGYNYSYYGRIKHIAYSSLVSRTTSDATGYFELKVPSTADGLPIKVYVSEYAADQTLLLNTKWGQNVWGQQIVRTIFGSDVTPSAIPTVDAAYVTFAPPTGAGGHQPLTPATAVARVSESGIVSYSIKNQGEGYTQAPKVIISKGSGFNPIAAEATAVLSSYGRVTSLNITSAGTGYAPNDVPTVTFEDGISQTATAELIMGYSVKNINVTNGGSGYTSTPSVTISGSEGSGATASANMAGIVNKINLTNTGSGYTDVPKVVFTGGEGSGAAATANMSIYNPLHSIILDNYNTLFLLGTTPNVVISPNGTGSGATATCQLDNNGSVTSLNITNVGAGYTEAPAITITGGGGYGATAYSTLGVGGSLNIILNNGGEGYTSAPTINIPGAPLGGTNAVANAIVSVKAKSITITNAGAGYNNKPFISVGGIFIPDANYAVKFSKQVNGIALTNNGDNYTSAPSISFVSNDGNGSGAAATTEMNYYVKSVSINEQGANYLNGSVNVHIAPPAIGTPATATAALFNGKIKRVILTNPGLGYTANPIVMLNQVGGSAPLINAVIDAVATGNKITSLTTVNAGEGYDPAGTYSLTISTHTHAASAGVTVNPTAGQITFIEITDQGSGYSVVPNVEFEIPNGIGAGTGATATAVLTEGRVTSINITNAGTGYYTAPTVRVHVPTTNLQAIGKVSISADGRITGVTFPATAPYTRGYGYVNQPTVTFTPSVLGMGTGAIAIATIENGSIKDVIMSNQGSGYLGKNRPTTAQSFGFIPYGAAGTSFLVHAGKTYIKDINLGTGRRTVED